MNNIKKSRKLMNDVSAQTGLSPALCFYAMKFGIMGLISKPKKPKKLKINE